MTILIFLLLIQTIASLPLGPEKIQIPEVNISSPQEINNLNHGLVYNVKRPEATQENANNYPEKINLLDKAVERVENILRQNSSLPRLTKGEILDIIENITNKDINELNKTRSRIDDQRALMLVMPYTASNSDKSHMEELYTRPPVTHIVGDDEENKPHRRRRPTLPPMPQSPTHPPATSTTTVKTTTPEIVTKIAVLEGPTEDIKPAKKTETKHKNTKGQNNQGLRKRRPVKPTQKHTNHKYPGDNKPTPVLNLEPRKPPGPNFFTNQGFKLIEASKFVNPTTPASIRETSTIQPLITTPKTYFESTARPFTPDESAKLINDLSIPENLKWALESLDLDVSTTAKPQPQIKDLLSAIKRLKPTTTTTTTTTSTTTSFPNIANIADTLTPEMKELLLSFGLLPDPHSTAPPTLSHGFSSNPNPADIEADSYVQFKPLPDEGPAREEMDQFLARFGLGRSSRQSGERKDSTTEKTDSQGFNIEMVPENLRDVLTDIGLTDRQGKAIRSDLMTKTFDKGTERVTTEKQHIFNPTEPTQATNEELDKLNKLLDVIKTLDKLNGSVSDEEIRQKVNLDEIKELVATISQDQFVPLDQDEGPNPLHFDYGTSKNEFKRQENSSTEAPPPTTTIASETTTSIETSTSNLKALEESFGGVSAEEVTQTIPPPTSSTVRTGFYYLLDWNTFLDIDDQKGRRVNLRFQPKVGDPKQFLAVSVP